MLSQFFLWFDCSKKSNNLLLPFTWLLVPIAWIDSSFEKCIISQRSSNFLSINMQLKANITKLNYYCDTLYHDFFLIFLIMGVNLNSNWLPYAQYELELGLAAMCTMWVHNVNLNLGWLPCAQNIDHPNVYFKMEISQWQTNVF